jgi:ARG/rhodanese/phosphatase superfamily protein
VNNFLKLGFIHYNLDVHTLLEFSLFHIPPAADVIVPVTCVKAGRWNRQSRGFSSSSRTHYAAGHAAGSPLCFRLRDGSDVDSRRKSGAAG